MSVEATVCHEPELKIDKAVEHLSEREGVDIQYVCTTEIRGNNIPVDVFYRETPHPEFGNRYFGLYHHPLTQKMMICDADVVEEYSFGMVIGDSGALAYSRYRHDYKEFANGNMIDGGRQYIRSTGSVEIYKVKDGVLVPA